MSLEDDNTNGVVKWFSSDMVSIDVVKSWNDSERDEKLFKLSKWEHFNATQFKMFVEHQIRGLEIQNSSVPFFFLEVGIGVGAFSRHVLHLFPNSSGRGLDIDADVINIARAVLDGHRMTVQVGNMLHIEYDSGLFDYVLVPGSICYLNSMLEVHKALSELARVLKQGGRMCLSMIASDTSPTGSCRVRIPKNVFSYECQLRFGLEHLITEEMDSWGLPHALGRYSSCLQKV
jgi:SAM-dependent methyltransferase